MLCTLWSPTKVKSQVRSRRIHTRSGHAELLRPGTIGCLNSPGNCDGGVTPIRGVCPTTRGNDGRLPRASTSSRIFVEHRHGITCSQEQPYPKRLCMFRWMDQGWPTCSSSTNRATRDSHLMQLREVLSELISRSMHFAVNPLPLAEGWRSTMAASERCRQQS